MVSRAELGRHSELEGIHQLKVVRAGCLMNLEILHPLTCQVLESRKNLHFSLRHKNHLKAAVVNLRKNQGGGFPSGGINLPFKCSLFEISIEIGEYSRRQRFVLFYLNLRDTSKHDIFFCRLKLNTQVLITMYFEPVIKFKSQGPSREEHDSRLYNADALRLIAIHLEAEKIPLSSSSLISKSSFTSTIKKVNDSQTDSNFRLNLSMPKNEQELIVCEPHTLHALKSLEVSNPLYLSFFRPNLSFHHSPISFSSQDYRSRPISANQNEKYLAPNRYINPTHVSSKRYKHPVTISSKEPDLYLQCEDRPFDSQSKLKKSYEKKEKSRKSSSLFSLDQLKKNAHFIKKDANNESTQFEKSLGNQNALEIKKNLNSKSRDLWEDDMEFGSRNEESYQRRSKELEGYFENEPKKMKSIL